MVFLQPSATESAFVFSTDDGSDAILLDVKGVYALIDGGNEPLRFMDSVRTPSAAILSTASPSSLTNAIELNKKSDSLVAVVGNLPSPASLKDAAAAQPIRELYKTLAVAPVVAQLKGAKPEPIVIHKGLSSGTLSVYTLAGDAKDAEAVAKAYQSGSSDSIEAAAAAASSVLLIVWQPVREDAPIKRILHLGSAPLSRIQQALSLARSLPFLQSSTPTAASLKAKPAASAAPSRPAARSAAAPTAAAKPAARVAPAARPAAPAARPAPAARATPTAAAAARPSSVRASLPTRPAPTAAAPASPATRPARTSAAATRPAVPAGRGAARPSGGAAREEVAKKTVVGKSAAAPSTRSAASSASSTPNGSASRTSSKAAAPASAAASPAAAAALAATTVVAASLSSLPLLSPSEQSTQSPAAPLIVTTDVVGESMDEGGETPGGLPVPASPTIIPATPQPPMSPEPEEEKQEEPVRDLTPSAPPPAAAVDDAAHEEKEEGVDSLLDATQASTDAAEEEEDAAAAAAVVPPTPSASLEPAASMDEPECVKEMVEEEPEVPHEETEPVEPVEPSPLPTPTPVDPSPVGDLLGDFDTPVQPQQPGEDGLLDSLEEPMKKMQISMDTDKLAEELGLTGGEKGEEREEGEEGDESLLDLTQPSIMDNDLDKTQNTSVIESAHEYDDLLSPRRMDVDDHQRKLSEQAEENLLSAAAAPFIAGLASTVVEAATIDGAKSTLESLISVRSVESPTGDKLLSFRSSGFENPDEPKEVKYEESDPAIDDVLTKLAEESEMVNGGLHHGELNGHSDSGTGANGHHIVNGGGWPEGTSMHLPPHPSVKGGSAREAKFKLAGPVHVDLVTVPHRGKQILLNDEAASLEFFSSVRSSMYIVQSGGEVPVHVMDGWLKGKGQWAVNVPSRLIPTHHNETVARWTQEHGEELAEVGLSVATPVDLTTLTYPDGQAKACTIVL